MNIIVFCYGTRPEFIKIAPVVLVFKRKYPQIKTALICSGQHQELLQGLNRVFNLKTQYDLNVRSRIGNTDDLSELGSGLLSGFSRVFNNLKPTVVVVQGDAATTYYATLAAFHQQIPIAYVEAGLRTYDLAQPFPEEGYRQMISRLATVCFAPTAINRNNLLREGINKNQIHVVGNTVVDALQLIVRNLTKKKQEELLSKNIPQLRGNTKKLVVVEVHRRENYGKPLINILKALRSIQHKNPDYVFVFPAHPSRHIRPIVEKYLKDRDGFIIIQPPVYQTFIALLKRATLVITDSGGLQEEVPAFGIPAIVVREKTERVEGAQKGWSIVVGSDTNKIIKAFRDLSEWHTPRGVNPYGDGRAGERIAKILSLKKL